MVDMFKTNGVVASVVADSHSHKTRSRAVKAKAPVISLAQPGRLRMANLMAIFSCSHTTIYQRIKTGEFPKPDGYDWPNRPAGKQGRPYWNTETIRVRLEG